MIGACEINAQMQRSNSNRSLTNLRQNRNTGRVFSDFSSLRNFNQKRELNFRTQRLNQGNWDKSPNREISNLRGQNYKQPLSKQERINSLSNIYKLNNILREKQSRSQQFVLKYQNKIRGFSESIKSNRSIPFSIAICEPRVKYNLLLMQRMYIYVNYLNRITQFISNGLKESEYLEEVSILDKEMEEEFSDEELQKIISDIDEIISNNKFDNKEFPVKIQESDIIDLETIYNKALKDN